MAISDSRKQLADLLIGRSPSPLGSLLASPPPTPPKNALSDIVRLLSDQSPAPKNYLEELNAAYPFAAPFGFSPDNKPVSTVFGGIVQPPTKTLTDVPTRPALPVVPKKRMIFFSFNFADVLRVNNVRKGQEFIEGNKRSFRDSSLWEARKTSHPETVKEIIRKGIEYTSAACVLIGSETWTRRFVKYEIARAIVDARGLLAVHLNSIPHHQEKTPHPSGFNPLDFMGIYSRQPNALAPRSYYLCELVTKRDTNGRYGYEWHQYEDYVQSVKLPRWVADPGPDRVAILSHYASTYDYVGDTGYKNIGAWIDAAAGRAGR